jgi:hypothetical protein
MVVFNVSMKRSMLATAASAGIAAALVPAAATAQVIELGATKSPLIAPVCPTTVSAANCKIVLTQVTGLETIRDGSDYPTTVKKAGVIVAFTLGLSRLDSNAATAKSDISFLDGKYGGTTQAAITVLKPVGKRNLRRWQVTAESPLFHLQPYLGNVAQFPLAASLGAPGTPPMAAPLPVAKGDTIALTVPTWAPVLTFGLDTKSFAYRQSRKANCQNPASTEQGQLLIGASTQYLCDYTGTRIEYSATEVTTPVPPKTQIHAADVPASTMAAPVTQPTTPTGGASR